jgi:AcrR family transcriptional regulator
LTASDHSTDEISTRERILREASRLFAKKGYHGTSTREIAEAVEIRQPSLFHHFPSKALIMGELIDLSNDQAAAMAQEQAEAEGSAALRLYRYLAWDIAYICRCPYDLSSAETVLTEPAFVDKNARHERLLDSRRAMIQEAVDTGEFIKLDIDLAEKTIIWMLRGDISDTAGRVMPDADVVADQLASFILRALLSDPDRLDEIRAEAGN